MDYLALFVFGVAWGWALHSWFFDPARFQARLDEIHQRFRRDMKASEDQHAMVIRGMSDDFGAALDAKIADAQRAGLV